MNFKRIFWYVLIGAGSVLFMIHEVQYPISYDSYVADKKLVEKIDKEWPEWKIWTLPVRYYFKSTDGDMIELTPEENDECIEPSRFCFKANHLERSKLYTFYERKRIYPEKERGRDN